MRQKLIAKLLHAQYRQEAFIEYHYLKQKGMSMEQYTSEFDMLWMRCDVVEEKEQTSRGGSVDNQWCFKCQGLGHLIADYPNRQLVTLVEEDVDPVYDDYEDYDEGLEDHLTEGEKITYADSDESLVRSGITEAIILATNETAGHVRNKDAVVHSYNNGFSGFAARLSEAESKSIAQRPGVISVFPDPILQLHTTRSWDFLQYQTEVVITSGGSDNSSIKGADTIVGILDTGIWPEAESFNDNDMSEVPSRWKGTCMKSHDSSSFKCNKKLVGVRFYGDDDEDGVKPSGSARDQNGHGTHVASTAAGSPISGASYYGLGFGIAKGGSPGSRIAMYHVCTDGGCHESSIMAFDDAIADRVDVLSLSLGSLSGLQAEFLSDPIAIGAFHAIEKGILVACSAGNQGPQAETVVNVVPWILTVAATMIDRDFETHIVLGGNKVMIKGGGISFGNLTSSPVYPLITGDLAKSANSDVSRYCLPNSVGIFAISHSCSGVAARACGFVSLEPTKIAKILKDRPPWFRDRQNVEVFTMFPAGSGSTIELLLIPSGYLIRPYDSGGSIIHIVDHLNLEAWSAPEILRPLYESSKVVAQKKIIAALRYARQLAQETSAEVVYGLGRQPAVLRTFSQRLCRGFNDAINGFSDDGWLMLSSDGAEDVIVAVSSRKNPATTSIPLSPLGGILCAKASMLLQNVPPAVLVRFLREHRSEWADFNVDAFVASALKSCPYTYPGMRPTRFTGSQIIMPLGHTIEHEEMLEVIRLEGHSIGQEDAFMPRDIHLLQMCSGTDENAIGACSELVFAPIDEMFPDDAPLLPSGFRIIPLESKSSDAPDTLNAHRTLDLASSLEVGPATSSAAGDAASCYSARSVLTIAFQFPYEDNLQDNVATMARQYVRSVVSSVQRVAMAISPTGVNPSLGAKLSPGSPEAVTLSHWICQSYSYHMGTDLLRTDSSGDESVLKNLWQHQDAILCCSLKSLPVFIFANKAGLDMLETTLVALQDISLDKIFDESGRKVLFSEFPKIMEQGFACLPGGICMSAMGRHISYEQAIAWKVFAASEENAVHCLAFSFINWSFV